MSQATVPCGLTPKLFCSLVDSVISEVGEQGRCTLHIPKLLSPSQFLGGCSGTAPPCPPQGHSPNPLSASSGKQEKRSMAPALPLESGLGPVNRNCLSNEVLLPTG